MRRDKKEIQIGELTDIFRSHNTFYLLDFKNMKVVQAINLRRNLKKNSCSLRIVKNRLALRALGEEFPEGLKNYFSSPTAIAYTVNDPVALARLIKDFSSQNKVLTVKAGFVQGHLVGPERFEEITRLTSREDLLGKIGYLMAYPLKQFLRTWQAPLSNVGMLLSQLKSKK